MKSCTTIFILDDPSQCVFLPNPVAPTKGRGDSRDLSDSSRPERET